MMLRRKIAPGLAVAAMAAMSLTFSAFAAGTDTQAARKDIQTAKSDAADSEFTVSVSDDSADKSALPLKIDGSAPRQVRLEDGTVITVSRAAVKGDQEADLIISFVPAK